MYEQLTIFDPLKRCSMCKENKPLQEFYWSKKRGGDGYASRCKDCSKACYHADKDRQQLLRKRGYEQDRDRVLEQCREYREANKEKRARYNKEWAKRNPEKTAAKQKRYLKRHPRQVALNNQRRKARKREATVEPVFYEAIVREFGMMCHICGLKIVDESVLHMDHVIPLSRGGEHGMANIRPSHAKCNQRKGSKLLEEMEG